MSSSTDLAVNREMIRTHKRMMWKLQKIFAAQRSGCYGNRTRLSVKWRRRRSTFVKKKEIRWKDLMDAKIRLMICERASWNARAFVICCCSCCCSLNYKRFKWASRVSDVIKRSYWAVDLWDLIKIRASSRVNLKMKIWERGGRGVKMLTAELAVHKRGDWSGLLVGP